MIKVTAIIYFPIWLTSGLLKKSQKWFVFNCRASLEKMNYVAMWKGAFQVDSACLSSPRFFVMDPMLGILGIPP